MIDSTAHFINKRVIFVLLAIQPSVETAETIRRQYARCNFLLFTALGEQKLQAENHEKRLANMRKELAYLKSTEWKYDPIEKYIGQS